MLLSCETENRSFSIVPFKEKEFETLKTLSPIAPLIINESEALNKVALTTESSLKTTDGATINAFPNMLVLIVTVPDVAINTSPSTGVSSVTSFEPA